jgi:hypothetical protein
VPVPNLTAGRYIDAEEIVGDSGNDADFQWTLSRRHSLGDERRKQVVHRARGAFEFQLPQQLHARNVPRVEYLLVAHPAGSPVVDTLGQKIHGTGRDGRQNQEDKADPDNSHVW